MLIVTDETLFNRGVLKTSYLPKKFLGRVVLLPRGASLGFWLRLIVEMQMPRYMMTLSPFIVAPLIDRDLAVIAMQGPALMMVMVAAVELKVLGLSKPARARIVTNDEAARRLDTLAFRARACLRHIAARHEMAEGELRLVIEQSQLANIPPLTLVSVQTETPEAHLPPLDAKDRAVLQAGLFDAGFTERDLLMVNHRDSLYLREVAQEARAVSAHSRLAAFLEKRAVAS
ncbi:hypothetical protein [Rhodobacter ferrooxidans]|uniref:Uncharacterized protein n=1 Tax=Rhodobacter ferrooxidans TaxID=371731 RepID=C8S5A2_9RHOB|nr:hypothetical protein [Rhodobacter sp. SW2]EEW23835.1 conserved hypothetical protein [Rhodobacter sp. SW2]